MLILGLLLIASIGSSVAAVPTRRTNLCYKNITQPTRCLYLSHPTFLEMELPYRAIALPEYTPGLKITGDEIIRYSQRWLEVKRILPKCWPDLQVALTSILMPQCDEDPITGYATKIYQPSYDICNDLVNRNNCQFLERHYGWLPMFNCSDTNLYNRNCTNNLRELKSQSAPALASPDTCRYPLVASNNSKLWFKDVTGCALHCKYPITNPQDHSSITSVIGTLGMIGLLSTTLAIVLYVINNRKASRMAEVIKQCTLCQFLIYIGWLMQFVYNQEIACSPNGATLYGKSNICIMTFFLTYAPSLASLMWCAYLARLCFEKLTGIKREDSKGPAEIDRNVYLFCYGTPMSLFIIVSLLGEIESHGLYGICTVGQHSNITIKFVFLHIPTVIGVIYENFYFLRTIYKVKNVKDKNPRLKRNLARIMALATLSTIHLGSSIGRNIYELKIHDGLIESIDKYLACSLNLDKVNEYDYYDYSTVRPECTVNTRPMTVIYYIELFSTLSMGIVIASWAFCEANLRSLRRKLVALLEDDKDLEHRDKIYQRIHNESGVVTEPEETHHDVIDMTTSDKKPQEISLIDQGGNRQNVDIDTASSVGSVSLDVTDRGVWYKKRKNAQLANRTARDVIRDTRQPQQQFGGYEPEVDQSTSALPHFNPQIFTQLLLSQLFPHLLPNACQPGPAVNPLPVSGQVQQPFSGAQPAFAPNIPPWGDKSETPQFNFTHGSAQRPDGPTKPPTGN